MTGQDAVTIAEAFHETLALDGVILDQARRRRARRRGALGQGGRRASDRVRVDGREARRLRAVPPRSPGEPHPRHGRRAHASSRRPRRSTRRTRPRQAAAKLLEGQFTLDDFLDQMQQLKKMGPLSSIVGMIPGLPKEARRRRDRRSTSSKRVEAIIRSMTLDERRKPDLIERIAAPPHRQRQRHDHRRGQCAAQAVQGRPEDDEAHGRPWHQEGEAGPTDARHALAQLEKPEQRKNQWQ